MNRDKLRQRAALIAFQTLLQRNEERKDDYVTIENLAEKAWEYAKIFIEDHPASLMCEQCRKMSEIAEAGARLGPTGAGPRREKQQGN
jgi:hypothetical protein